MSHGLGVVAAKRSGVVFTSIAVEAEGFVDKVDGRTRFTEIVLRPKIALAVERDRQRLARVLDKTERACLVAASLATPVRLETDAVG